MVNPTTEDLLRAHAAFYEAFADRDLARMDAVWCTQLTPTCVHPGWPPVRGRTEVLETFRAIFGGEGPAPVCEAPGVQRGSEFAVVLCRERLEHVVLVATNVFVHEPGGWKLLHHHASGVAQIPETPPLDPDFMPN